MKRLLSLFFLCMLAVSAFSQVQFSKFKFIKDEPLGMFPGRKAIDCKFKNTSGRTLKYVKVWYYAVNAVGDVVSGTDRGFVHEGKEYVKPKRLDMTGPFDNGKTIKRYASGIITATDKNTRAVPFILEITFMDDDTTEQIQITEENIGKYFPGVEWVDYNRWNKEL